MTEAPSSYLDWIAKNGVTQFYGPIGIGKTTLLQSLRDTWPGNRVLILPGTLHVQNDVDLVAGYRKLTVTVPSMEQMLKAVGHLLEKLLTENDLIVVDDTSVFALEKGTPAGNSQAWGLFLRHTRAHNITVVLGTQTRRVNFDQGSAKSPGPDSPRVMAYSADLKYELEEIARSEEGVVVEVITRKSKFEIPGNVKGRLWVRPEHAVPVRST